MKERIYLSEVLDSTDPSKIVDDTTIIHIDEEIQTKSKGLLCKTMSRKCVSKII